MQIIERMNEKKKKEKKTKINSTILTRDSYVSVTNFSLNFSDKMKTRIRQRKHNKLIPIERTPERCQRFNRESEADKENK